MNQHELMVSVLVDAGGVPAENVVPAGYKGKIADVLFAAEDVVVEVKSLTTDRANDPKISEVVGEMFSKNTHLGAPVIFGQVTIGLHDLAPPVATLALRILGRRVQDETKAANTQIKATKAVLGRPDAVGLVVLITPPFRLDRQSIIWTMNDAMRGGTCSGVDSLLLVETPLAAPPGVSQEGASFLSLHGRGKRGFPAELAETIGQSWGCVTGQRGRHVNEEDFHNYGATS